MSRSYHITEKQAQVAFLRGDNEPTFLTSEKSWVKKKSLSSRVASKLTGKNPKANRAIVARENERTKDALSAIEYRKNENGA